MSTETVLIKSSSATRQKDAQALLDAAGTDRATDVRVLGDGFAVPRDIAESAGLLESSVEQREDESGATTSAQGNLVPQDTSSDTTVERTLLTADEVRKPALEEAAVRSAQSTEGLTDPLAGGGDTNQAGTTAQATVDPQSTERGTTSLAEARGASVTTGSDGDAAPSGTSSGTTPDDAAATAPAKKAPAKKATSR